MTQRNESGYRRLDLVESHLQRGNVLQARRVQQQEARSWYYRERFRRLRHRALVRHQVG